MTTNEREETEQTINLMQPKWYKLKLDETASPQVLIDILNAFDIRVEGPDFEPIVTKYPQFFIEQSTDVFPPCSEMEPNSKT